MQPDDPSLPAWTQAPLAEVRANGFSVVAVDLVDPRFVIHAHAHGKMRCFEYTYVDGVLTNTTAHSKATQKQAVAASRAEQPK